MTRPRRSAAPERTEYPNEIKKALDCGQADFPEFLEELACAGFDLLMALLLFSFTLLLFTLFAL
jgi:hypothetical protein